MLVLDTPSLGDRSYLAHDGTVAVVIDPQRDIDRVLDLAARHGVRITDVLETHIHNDYVTGGLALAQATGATYHVNADDPVTFTRHAVRDADVVEVSPLMQVRVISTPGHTYTHLSYVLETPGGTASDAVAVFTGGSLLVGATGRPDLLGQEHTDLLVRHQYASAHRLAHELPGHTPVLPTHGFGSFCSAGSGPTGVTAASHPAARAADPARGGPALRGLGPLRRRLPGLHRDLGPGRPHLAQPRGRRRRQLRRARRLRRLPLTATPTTTPTTT
ncbi:MBL fold metallo-hydrolase [Dermatophilaceae bacterium Soc4.6]